MQPKSEEVGEAPEPETQEPLEDIEEKIEAFSPSMLKVKKRHTRILGTINKKADKEFIDLMVRYGMDGVRVFCDYGYDTC